MSFVSTSTIKGEQKTICGKGNNNGYHMCGRTIRVMGKPTKHDNPELEELHKCSECGMTWTEEEYRKEYKLE